MKQILILGAGLVSEPGIAYLLNENRYRLTVADLDLSKAEKVLRNSTAGSAVSLDVQDDHLLRNLIGDADIVVSLLPWTYHTQIGIKCLEAKKHLVTASYVSDEMLALDRDAKAAGLIFLNEIGLDPGIDHMSAMEIIDRIHEEGGEIKSFWSITGGLPAPESNTNPMGYKFSWSPRGVILASRNSAEYLKDNRVVRISGEDLFLHCWKDHIDPIGDLEIYPNRISLPYRDKYGLEAAETVFRGTYRYPGWCKTMKAISDLGWLSDHIPVEQTFGGYTLSSIKSSSGVIDNPMESTAKFLGLNVDSDAISRLEWLGLFDDRSLPGNTPAIDILCATMEEKMQFEPGERDMVVMQHQIEYVTREGRSEKIISTLIEYGEPEGYSAMARTVSLPLASGVKCILEGEITLSGVVIPTKKEIYAPVLQDLKNSGIRLTEKLALGLIHS